MRALLFCIFALIVAYNLDRFRVQQHNRAITSQTTTEVATDLGAYATNGEFVCPLIAMHTANDTPYQASWPKGYQSLPTNHATRNGLTLLACSVEIKNSSASLRTNEIEPESCTKQTTGWQCRDQNGQTHLFANPTLRPKPLSKSMFSVDDNARFNYIASSLNVQPNGDVILIADYDLPTITVSGVLPKQFSAQNCTPIGHRWRCQANESKPVGQN